MKMTSLLRLVALVQICLGASAYANGTESYVEAEKYIIECSRDWAESVVTGDMSRRKIYFADDFMGTTRKVVDATKPASRAKLARPSTSFLTG
jgi:hypothetical protein